MSAIAPNPVPAAPRAGAARPLVLGRYDETALLGRFAEAGVLEVLARRGFTEPDFEIDASRGPLTHARMFGTKNGARHLLIDACLTEVHLEPERLATRGCPVPAPVDLVVAYWMREQDPTARFDARHPRLPLQKHPGLGALRRAFRAGVKMARELDKDGIAALPKFFHDAVIFYESRLFLFLDPREQGRFEAMLRDLKVLSLLDATLAFMGDAVRDEHGVTARWQPGLQIMPLTDVLTSFFHSPAYQDACCAAYEDARFTWNVDALAEARRVFERSQPEAPAALR